MAVLTSALAARRAAGISWLPLWRGLAVCALLATFTPKSPGQTATSEYQIKAVFLFNFVQFVDWPPDALPGPQAPLVIGVLGEDPFGSFLDEAVAGEKVNDHPLVVRRFRQVSEIDTCHVLFVSRSEQAHLKEIFAALKGRSILLVGESEGFSVQGGIIRFVSENNKVRMRINITAAKTSHLLISSKLLRAAEIVTTKD